jgi:hypothetical protein
MYGTTPVDADYAFPDVTGVARGDVSQKRHDVVYTLLEPFNTTRLRTHQRVSLQSSILFALDRQAVGKSMAYPLILACIVEQ